GGAEAALVALDKKSGKVMWKCVVPENSRATHSAVVAATIGGVKQYVHQLDNCVVGVTADTGKLLWSLSPFGDWRGNVHTALVAGDEVFASCGWNVGTARLKVKRDGADFHVEEAYRNHTSIDPWLGSSVRLGDYVHTADGRCINWKTGEATIA